MWIPLNETIGCVDERRTEARKAHNSKNFLSQTCMGSLSTSDATFTSEFTTESNQATLGKNSLGNIIIGHPLSRSADFSAKQVSICATISAISSLDQGCSGGRCLTCSLDGLRSNHPRCTIRTNSTAAKNSLSDEGRIKTATISSPSTRAISEKISPNATMSSANFNLTFLSSITLSSTWPIRRSVKERSLNNMTSSIELSPSNDDTDNDIILDYGSTELHCSGSESDNENVPHHYSEHFDLLEEKNVPCLIKSIDLTLNDTTASHGTSATECFDDDLCEDWDDGHDENEIEIESENENDGENDNDSHNNTPVEFKAGKAVDDIDLGVVAGIAEIEVEVYTVSARSSFKIHNEVMSTCDWSFMQENKLKRKNSKKNSRSTEKSASKGGYPFVYVENGKEVHKDYVSSCSQSDCSDDDGNENDSDEEDDDDGDIDTYFMNKISKKNKHLNNEVFCNSNNLFCG